MNPYLAFGCESEVETLANKELCVDDGFAQQEENAIRN